MYLQYLTAHSLEFRLIARKIVDRGPWIRVPTTLFVHVLIVFTVYQWHDVSLLMFDPVAIMRYFRMHDEIITQRVQCICMKCVLHFIQFCTLHFTGDILQFISLTMGDDP